MENQPYELTSRQKGYLPIKRILDIVICLPVCIILSPLMVLCAISIKIDSPGPILFKQMRIGKDKEKFEIWKFRTMRISTPKDVPTHMLRNPDAYITKTGKFMRKYSIDEFPQFYQCMFTNKLSLIGPRPALWNQDDLVEERDKYGANILKPGISGWAQINGRDELEIPDKAKLDGEYVEKLGLWMDIKCFLGTIGSVLNHDGVKEGGTGEMHRRDEDTSKKVSSEKINKEIIVGGTVVTLALAVGSTILGFMIKKTKNSRERKDDRNSDKSNKWITGGFVLAGVVYMVYINLRRKVMLEDYSIDTDSLGDDEGTSEIPKHKNILIAGENSYIGMSVEKWLNKANEKYSAEIYQVATLNLLDKKWREQDFSQYDVVYHVAGIAHADVGSVSEEQKQLYYKINTDLAVEVAEKAKESGVKQFIFMSSMIVYSGCREKIITKETRPKPLNFYGDSKWKADKRIRGLEDDLFKVVILRPPMIYGKGSKGNYPYLVKLAEKLPMFPIVINKRSMLYIENLCEFVKLMIDNEESGVFFPQNGEYTNTSDMVQMIAGAKGHQIVMIPGFGWAVSLLMKMPGKMGKLADKAFGDLAYGMEMSEYKEDYRVCNLNESIKITEGEDF